MREYGSFLRIMAAPSGHAGLMLSLALASTLPATLPAFQASLSPLHQTSTGRQIFPRAVSLQRLVSPCCHRQKPRLQMREDTPAHKKVPSGQEKGFLRKKIALSDAYQEDSRQYRRTVFEVPDWCVTQFTVLPSCWFDRFTECTAATIKFFAVLPLVCSIADPESSPRIRLTGGGSGPRTAWSETSAACSSAVSSVGSGLRSVR